MAQHTYIPNGRLSAYVEFIWCSIEYNPQSAKERVLPSGASQLIINLGSKKFRHFGSAGGRQEYTHTIVTGIHTGHIFLDPTTRISTMGVVLRPGATAALFGVPATEFKNRVISLGDLLSADMSSLRDRLIAAPTSKDRFHLLETFLCRQLDPGFRIKPAITFGVKQIDLHHGATHISDIREKTGYSRRWFSKSFKEMAGITPKQYARICRFQHVLSTIREHENPNWPELAISCGYFDQSHLINDFRELTGISPTDYHRKQPDQKNHLPE